MTDINFFVCHDDICMARGPVCSPAWLREFIYPYYEEFFGYMNAVGIRVIFMTDGNPQVFVDDIMSCGARGIITEPFMDYKIVARNYENCFLAGEGDNRVLTRNNPDEIKAMVTSMVETGRMTGGYMMCVGNHIPWNVTPQGIQRYLDLSAQLAHR